MAVVVKPMNTVSPMVYRIQVFEGKLKTLSRNKIKSVAMCVIAALRQRSLANFGSVSPNKFETDVVPGHDSSELHVWYHT